MEMQILKEMIKGGVDPNYSLSEKYFLNVEVISILQDWEWSYSLHSKTFPTIFLKGFCLGLVLSLTE